MRGGGGGGGGDLAVSSSAGFWNLRFGSGLPALKSRGNAIQWSEGVQSECQGRHVDHVSHEDQNVLSRGSRGITGTEVKPSGVLACLLMPTRCCLKGVIPCDAYRLLMGRGAGIAFSSASPSPLPCRRDFRALDRDFLFGVPKLELP